MSEPELQNNIHTSDNRADSRFRKSERVCLRRDIESLFRSGEAFLVYPLRCSFIKIQGCDRLSRVMVMVSAPKRHHKRAVKRNLLKRRIREAYRLNKSSLAQAAQQADISLNLSISYISKEITDYQTIEHAVIKILDKVAQKIGNTTANSTD